MIRGFNFRRLARRWKLLNFQKLFYFPRILNTRERTYLLIVAAIVLLSGGFLLGRIYFQLTKPVPQIGKSYTEGVLKEPRTINPLYAAHDPDQDMVRLVFSRLLSYNGRGEIEPDLAERYEISKDGKTYTLTLRSNAQWHDGKPVTSDDVLFTIATIQNPLYKSPLRVNWQGVSVEKIDQRTVRFTLRTPYAPFIENLALGILPKHLWQNINPEQALLHELNLKPVGSGPYKFSQFKQDKDGSILWLELVRNKKYYREGPYLKKIIFVFFKTEEELVGAWRRGSIEGFGPVSAEVASEAGSTRSPVAAIKMPRIFGLFLNQKKGAVLAQKSVREALARALNIKEIAATISGGAVVSSSPLPFLKTPDGEDKIRYPYDPLAAGELLEKAGWHDGDGDGIREKRSGKNVTALHLTLTTSDWPDLVKTADEIKRMLKEIGIEVAIEKKTFIDLEASVIKPRNFEMLLFGEVFGYEPDPFTFWHSSQSKDPGLNITLYANKKADQLLEEARRLSDPLLRKKKQEEFVEIMQQDIPAIFIYSQLYLYLLPSDMKGVNMTVLSLPADRFNEINKWYRKTKRVLQ